MRLQSTKVRVTCAVSSFVDPVKTLPCNWEYIVGSHTIYDSYLHTQNLTVLSRSGQMDLNRNLQIQAGVVRRLSKELIMYREEQEKEMQKVQVLKDTNADPHDIKYAVGRSQTLVFRTF